jgi:hypothetical protein
MVTDGKERTRRGTKSTKGREERRRGIEENEQPNKTNVSKKEQGKHG